MVMLASALSKALLLLQETKVTLPKLLLAASR
jgi:hypothetical protein